MSCFGPGDTRGLAASKTHYSNDMAVLHDPMVLWEYFNKGRKPDECGFRITRNLTLAVFGEIPNHKFFMIIAWSPGNLLARRVLFHSFLKNLTTVGWNTSECTYGLWHGSQMPSAQALHDGTTRWVDGKQRFLSTRELTTK